MLFLALGGGLLLAAALWVREYQLAKERNAHNRELEALRQQVERHKSHLRRTVEDLYVLRQLLVERHVLDEHDLVRGRVRLIEAPRRQAEERDAILRGMEISPNQLIVEESEPKIH